MSNLKGVREYDRIRRYLEGIYLYGFFSRDDFARAGIGSVKDYDQGTKLIRDIFPETEEAALWKGGKKYLRVQREYALSGENRMSDSYLLSAMDAEEELPVLLGILSSLAGGDKTVGQVCQETAIHTQVEDSLDYNKIRRWLLELAEYGYVEKTGRGYRLRENPLANLTENEVSQLYDYVHFAAGVTYPRVAGSFLLRTLERECHRQGLEAGDGSPFLLRHSVNRNVFDEDLVYRLMEAVEGHRMVEVVEKRDSLLVQPVALRIDERLGRWYLLAMGEKPLLMRVSVIRSIKQKDVLSQEKWAAGVQACQAAFAKSGCSGRLSHDGPSTVRACLHFEAAPGLETQFLRELRAGEVLFREDGKEYQAEINDPGELTAFVRSYSPWLTLESGAQGLRERVQRDLLEMRAQLKGDEGQ